MAFEKLRHAAEQAKIALSEADTAQIEIPEIAEVNGQSVGLSYELTRQEFDKLVVDLIQRTFKVCDEALQQAHLTVRDLDGMILVGGERSHLFYSGPVDDHNFTDFELKLEVMTTPGSNSGVFLHTEYQETGWPDKGHEAQVNNSHGDWRRTGSLYNIQDVRETPAKDNEWFEYHILVRGKQVTFKINGETVNEYTEADGASRLAERPGRNLSSGTIALQAHDPGSLVYYRNIRIKTPSTAATRGDAKR